MKFCITDPTCISNRNRLILCLPFNRKTLYCYSYELTRICLSLRVTIISVVTRYTIWLFFKELWCFSSRFGAYILFSLLLFLRWFVLFKVFQFCKLQALRFLLCFPVCFGTAKVRIFFEFCKKFFLFFLRPFVLIFFCFFPSLFKLPAALRRLLFYPLFPFGIAKVRLFFLPAK